MHAAADAAVGEYVAMTDSYCMGRETSFFSSLLPIARVEVVVVFCTTIINFNICNFLYILYIVPHTVGTNLMIIHLTIKEK